MILTYRYRLLPSKRQHRALVGLLDTQRALYNAALEERIDCYRKTGKGVTFIDQCKSLTSCRRDIPEMGALPVNLQRWTLKRLDEAFQGFFRRIKAHDRKAGFPRFRGKGWWDSFGFGEFSGIRFDGARLRFSGMPSGLKLHMHRPLPDGADIRSCVFRRDGRGWHVSLQIAVEAAEKRVVEAAVGLDLGLTTLAYLSDGVTIPNPQIARKTERKMRLRQRALSRCQRRSNSRRKVKARLARLHRKVANTRKCHLHAASAMLVRNYDLVAVEALNVKGLARSMLARSVHDASWSTLIEMLRYKAARAGVHLIEVDPRFTSQDCSGCGERVAKLLSQRVHHCPACGLVLDRDENAARNILARAAGNGGWAGNVTECGERRPGNIRRASVRKSSI
jgi:putative transposase